MLYSFFGSDIGNVRTAARKRINALLKNDATAVTITGDTGSLDAVREALGATSLFGGREVYVLDMVSEDEEFFASVLELLPALDESENVFILIEGAHKAAVEKLITKHSTESAVFEGKEKKEWNVFALTDALVARDKKQLWILLQDAWKHGRTSEEIIGTLFWQLKMLRLADVTTSALEAGQKPFVYDKAKRALRQFPRDLHEVTHRLVMLYHEGHGGKRDINHALEAWVLSL